MTNEEQIIRTLTLHGEHLAAAESCTGGGISRLITGIPGASAVYSGGMTAYDAAIKIGVLGVPAKIIEEQGVVSHETAISMAEHICSVMRTEWGVSTTGYAGPGGGDGVFPVGTVCFGIFSATHAISMAWHAQFEGDRNAVMDLAAHHLLAKFAEVLKSELKG